MMQLFGDGLMQYNSENIPRLSKLFTLLVIIYPLSSVYASPIKAVSFGDILLLICAIPMTINIVTQRRKLRVLPFWMYILYAFVITIVSSVLLMGISYSYSISNAINRIVRDAFFLLTIVIFGQYYFDFRYAKKALKIFTIILGCFIIFQSLIYRVAGIYIPGIIPQLATTISGGMTGAEYNSVFQYKAVVYGFIRSSGFLAEPAIVGQVVAITLLLELFNKDNKPNMILCVFYSLIMVLSFSTNSYVALIACWGLWALYSNRHNRNNIIKIIIVLFAMIILIVFLLKNENTASVFLRFFELRERTSGSSVIRVLRGIAFFINMPLLYQVFGSGFGNFLDFKAIYGITTIYEQADEYMNTDAYILVSAGIIGFALFIYTILRSIKGNEIVSKMIFIILLIFGISSSIYSTPQFMIMMMFILYAPKEIALNENQYYYAT